MTTYKATNLLSPSGLAAAVRFVCVLFVRARVFRRAPPKKKKRVDGVVAFSWRSRSDAAHFATLEVDPLNDAFLNRGSFKPSALTHYPSNIS